MQIISFISILEETKKTIKDFGEQLKIQLNSNLTQYGKLVI